MKHLALSWARRRADQLKRFRFVFHISLRNVQDDTPIERIIVEEHSQLKAKDVEPEDIKSILTGEAFREAGVGDQRVLLLLDGHDEYEEDTNPSIDDLIRKRSRDDCWLILTSREKKKTNDLRQFMHAEAEIKGFNNKKIPEYIEKRLGTKQRANHLLNQAERKGLIRRRLLATSDFGLLAIPLLLNMICVLFLMASKLPSIKVDLYKAILQQNMTREARRGSGSDETDAAQTDARTAAREEALRKLSELAWEGLLQDKLELDKVT